MKKNVIAKQITENNALIIDSIVDVVISEWNNRFLRDDIFSANIRGDAVAARNMVFVLTSKTTAFTPKEISKYFKKVSDFTVRNAICFFSKLDKNNKFDKIIIDRHERVLQLIK